MLFKIFVILALFVNLGQAAGIKQFKQTQKGAKYKRNKARCDTLRDSLQSSPAVEKHFNAVCGRFYPKADSDTRPTINVNSLIDWLQNVKPHKVKTYQPTKKDRQIERLKMNALFSFYRPAEYIRGTW